MRLFSVFFVMLCFCSACSSAGLQRVCVRDACVKVEIADSEIKREQGLMFRESLPSGRGMLFVFDEENMYGFWMKNTKIPLDIIWIGIDRRVVYIRQNVLPCMSPPCEVYRPSAKTKFVLEVNAGFVDKHGVRLGDLVTFR